MVVGDDIVLVAVDVDKVELDGDIVDDKLAEVDDEEEVEVDEDEGEGEEVEGLMGESVGTLLRKAGSGLPAISSCGDGQLDYFSRLSHMRDVELRFHDMTLAVFSRLYILCSSPYSQPHVRGNRSIAIVLVLMNFISNVLQAN